MGWAWSSRIVCFSLIVSDWNAGSSYALVTTGSELNALFRYTCSESLVRCLTKSIAASLLPLFSKTLTLMPATWLWVPSRPVASADSIGTGAAA
ncbi:hypothetical protein ASL10_09160 [Frigoribacterium sp. Leaf8]|nr:hypothetical protein ASL10_09160 [Frigoribacterium sp. Leaf8]